MTNSKKKGNLGEDNFARFLVENGVKAKRNGSSGGNIWKGDVHNGLGFGIEVKTVKQLNLLEAWYQAERDTSMSHAAPVLAVHFDQMPPDTWLMVMESGDWMDLLQYKLRNEGITPTQDALTRRNIAGRLRAMAEELDDVQHPRGGPVKL